VGVFISPERAVTRFFSLFDPRSHEGGGRQNSPKITCRPSQPVRNWPFAYSGRQDGCLFVGRRSCVEVSLRRASCRVCSVFVRVSESVQGHVYGAYPTVVFLIVFSDRRIAKYCLLLAPVPYTIWRSCFASHSLHRPSFDVNEDVKFCLVHLALKLGSAQRLGYRLDYRITRV